MNLDVRSALVGAGVFGLLAVAVAWQNPTRREVVQIPQPATALGGPISVVGIPAASEMVVIRPSAPYTVPANKLLVVTALGDAEIFTGTAVLIVDGVVEASTQPAGSGTSVVPLAPGLVVPSGSVVTPGNGPNARAWGWLGDA